MARGFWEHALAFLLIVLSITGCGVASVVVQANLDTLVPRLGTALGLYVCAALGGFFLGAALVVLTCGEPPPVHLLRAAAAGAGLFAGPGLTWLVMSRLSGTFFEHVGGFCGLGLLLFGLLALAVTLATECCERRAAARAERDSRERTQPGEAPDTGSGPPDA